MLKKLLYKEVRLALHPTCWIFLALAAMLLIPNYPYYVLFFYTCLGVFFTCLSGRENHDIFYSMLLPIPKRDIVRARVLACVGLQLLQALACVPFALLRHSFGLPNAAGMDANLAFFGLALAMLGLFNLVFFTRYYRNPDGVGRAFILGCAAVFGYMLLAEAAAFMLPFFRDVLDVPGLENLPAQAAVFAVGALAYCLLTLCAVKRSERSFEALDL